MTLAERPRADRERQQDAAWAVEALRRAESQLARRRQAACGPSDLDRAAMRFVLEEDDLGRDVTPGDLARHLEVTAASVSGLLDRLERGQLVRLRPHPTDGRKKLVRPVDRNDDLEQLDPLSDAIRSLADGLDDRDAAVVGRFLERITDLVDGECRD